MRTTNTNVEIKRQNKIRIVRYILKHGSVSRQELAVALGYSLPTVFQNVTELMDAGMLCEAGEYGSTGGRKAKVLRIRDGFCGALGIEVTKHDVRIVLVDLNRHLIESECEKLEYENSQEYYLKLGKTISMYLEKREKNHRKAIRIVGIGLAIPGTINHDLGMVQESAGLGIQNISIRYFTKYLPFEFCCESSVNSSAYVVLNTERKCAVYLSLDDCVEGAVFIDGSCYVGDNYRSAEFGKMILKRVGGSGVSVKKGSFNDCCSVSVLTEKIPCVDDFFKKLENNDEECRMIWEEYLDDLAAAITNIRMGYDCEIVLGGSMEAYLRTYRMKLEDKIREYNTTDFDCTYLKISDYRADQSAIGAAYYMLDRYVENLQLAAE